MYRNYLQPVCIKVCTKLLQGNSSSLATHAICGTDPEFREWSKWAGDDRELTWGGQQPWYSPGLWALSIRPSSSVTCLRVVFGCPRLRRSHPRLLVLSLGPARRAGWCRGACCRCRGCRACQQHGWVAGRRHRGCRAHRRCGWPVVNVAGAGPLDDVACRRGGAASSTAVLALVLVV